jgi:Sugar fermentation stimulation protein RE domain
VYTSDAQPYTRTAIFPHGAAKKQIGVVSDRAIKHLAELTDLQVAGVDGAGRRVRCGVLFLVNRGDCAAMRPCHEADPLFARVVARAEDAGVAVLAHDVVWDEQGGAHWGKALPVVYGEGVRGTPVGEAELAAVLHFNATDPRTHWKRARKDS